MPAMLHDSATRAALRGRIERLTPAATRKWGKMSVDQMLWHVSEGLAQAIGQVNFASQKAPLPPKVLKWIVLNVPWPKGSPTAPELLAGAGATRYDFEAERARCLSLMETFAAKRLDDRWADSFLLRSMSGSEWSRLHAIHLNHHLTQFSA